MIMNKGRNETNSDDGDNLHCDMLSMTTGFTCTASGWTLSNCNSTSLLAPSKPSNLKGQTWSRNNKGSIKEILRNNPRGIGVL